MKNGKFIVIEGVDSSGKATQAKELHERLLAKLNTNIHKISFPNYEDEVGSSLVKRYLKGGYGDDPDLINPYAASVFFAADRLNSFLTKEWGKFRSNNEIVIADRYTTSNLVHQGQKLKDEDEIAKFVSFTEDFEYNKVGLPKPDVVIMLSVNPEKTFELNANRKNKFDNSDVKDIHEKSEGHIIKSYNNAMQLSKLCGWVIVDCLNDEGQMRTIEDIANEIESIVMEQIKKED